MKLQEFVLTKAIVPSLKSAERDDVIREMIDAMIEAGAAPAAIRDELVKAIIDREKKGSTGFGKGVAIPHVRHVKIKKMAAGIGVSKSGVDFRALDKQPVFTIVVLMSPDSKQESHLHAMESIFSMLQNDTFRRFLRQATTTQHVLDLLADADAQPPR